MKPYYQKTFNRTALLVATLLVFALATVMPGQTAAETPIIVEAPTLDRDANLVINGSFEEGHPGTVAGPSNSPSEDSVYWALVDGGSGTHNPANRGDLSLYPDNVEMTPPGWTGSGGLANYAEWSSQWPGFPQFNIPPTGPALSTAPSEGEYSLYFGNFYMTSMDIPQDQMTITADGEWIFEDETGVRVDPVIFPGQPFSGGLTAEDFRPEVRLSQSVTGLCIGATYRLGFTAFGEFAHPDVAEFLGNSVADGFFGLEISGYDKLYLNIPGGADRHPLLDGSGSPFGPASQHTYTVEFVAPAHTVDMTFINWGHWNGNTRLDGTRYAVTRPAGIGQTTEFVLDDVILNSTECGVGTPGYWKNHPEAWPVDEITIGGVTYTKDGAIAFMLDNDSKDATYILFRSLVAAKLNELIGNESECVVETIEAADEWMSVNAIDSGVIAGGSDSPWRVGEPLYLDLDDYNNGLSCAHVRT